MIGDRADLTPLQGRAWDAAIDTSGYDPEQVAASRRARRRPLRVRVQLQRLSRLARQAGRRGLADVAPTARATGRTRRRPSAHVAAGRRRRARRADRRPARQRLPAAVVGAADRRGRRRCPRPATRTGRCRSSTRATSPRLARALAEQRIARRLQRHRPDRPDDDGRAARGRVAPPAATRRCAGSRTSKLEAAGVEPWMELPLWLPARHLGTWDVGTERRRPRACARGRSPRPSRDIWTWLRSGRRGRARRLARRAPPAEDERRARGSATPTSVLGIRAA